MQNAEFVNTVVDLTSLKIKKSRGQVGARAVFIIIFLSKIGCYHIAAGSV